MTATIPGRLELARRRRGLTQRALADLAQITPRSVGSFERGERLPSAKVLQQIAAALDFPLGFFSKPEIDPIGAMGASFRSLSSMTARQQNAVLAAGTLAVELNLLLEEHLDLPRQDIPSLDGDPPESAAHNLRAHWMLGERAVSNMVHLLEAKGVRVFSLTEDCLSVDAFSTWHTDSPFIFLNTIKTGERGRFDAAHELGHLAMHRHGGPQGREAEDEANRFASAFLMPAATIRTMAPRIPSINALMPIKRRWAVSVAAVLRRFYDLDLISQWHYDRLNVEIAKRGGRRRELGGSLPRETSQLLRKAFASLREAGLSRANIANHLQIMVDDLDTLVFGLVMNGIRGGGSTTEGEKPPLRLVR
jgi:Zn-dependent peptidase ImmA (M78 family)/DNA-binding XRE family transcriptional regulator